MSGLNQSQRIYDHIVRFPLHRDAEWNIQNRRWYLEYARQYGERCGIPKREEKNKNAEMDREN